MLNFLELSQNRRGMTLLELILTIALTIILLTTILSLLTYSNRSLMMADNMDEILLNGRFALEYIKGEILSADKIISSSKIKDLDFAYPTNIGFVIMEKTGNKYHFITYYRRNNELVRIACEKNLNNYPNQRDFKGYNQICSKLLYLENTNIDIENGIINLQLDMGEDEKSILEFKSTIFLRCDKDLN